MRIAIDARKLRDFGIGTYIRNILIELSRLDRETEYVVLCRPDDVTSGDVLGQNFRMVPETAPVAIAIVNGIEQGWPADKPPQLDPASRLTLGAAARGASADLQAAFGRLAGRWQAPDLFKAP